MAVCTLMFGRAIGGDRAIYTRQRGGEGYIRCSRLVTRVKLVGQVGLGTSARRKSIRRRAGGNAKDLRNERHLREARS